MAEVDPDNDAYRNKCLRIDLKSGEVFDTETDCLQLTVCKPDKELWMKGYAWRI